MKKTQILFESLAHLNAEEKVLLEWLANNLGGQIIVLAESRQEGIKTSDILCDNHRIELKTTHGNLSTLDTLLRKAAKQAQGDCVVVNLVQVKYSLQEACATARRRMQRSNLREVYLLMDGITRAHLIQNLKEETK